MRKLNLKGSKTIAFEDGCNKYLEYYWQRNLREGRIGHCSQGYTQFFKFFVPKIPINEIDENAYVRDVLHLRPDKRREHQLLSAGFYYHDALFDEQGLSPLF